MCFPSSNYYTKCQRTLKHQWPNNLSHKLTFPPLAFTKLLHVIPAPKLENVLSIPFVECLTVPLKCIKDQPLQYILPLSLHLFDIPLMISRFGQHGFREGDISQIHLWKYPWLEKAHQGLARNYRLPPIVYKLVAQRWGEALGQGIF